MSSESPNLSSIARCKLSLSVGSAKDCSLHRWVLLKNSITHSPSLTSSAASLELPGANPVYPHDDVDDDEDTDEVLSPVELDSFMFPDAGRLVPDQTSEVKTSEAQWLDSLLETLGDDEEDDYNSVNVSVSAADDDDDHFLSPLVSPMSSSDDLPNQSHYYSSPITVTYPCPVPYPPFHPPLIHHYNFVSNFDSSLSSLPPPYEDPLPYFDDYVEDLPVPDAIEDTSDDESDALSTPSFGRSSSSLPLVDAALVPLPTERSRLRDPVPHVYVDADDSYFYPFELAPLPSSDVHHHTSYNPYQEC
ncbi:hypothetical protein BDQ12DRAFT_644989 [Crucibulum laeve]|uniref:Uncharacterized protein n=1 Tax=Crucibulum laeve TaxID=68775 RepID=A0A5C3ME99_9AGAR|nr:hypothetical protein BDQ12DRAFT_644989 [Crucibulum laeve]